MPRPFRRGGGRPRRRPAGANNRRGGNNRRGPATGGFEEQGGNGVAVAQRSIALPPTMTVEELATLLSLRHPSFAVEKQLSPSAFSLSFTHSYSPPFAYSAESH